MYSGEYSEYGEALGAEEEEEEIPKMKLRTFGASKKADTGKKTKTENL